MSNAIPSDTGSSGIAPVTSLRQISPQQWRSGIAAWLGWFFDGLDIHLYTLVAAPFVAQLLHTPDIKSTAVTETSSWIQAAFLVGWALGGGLFGRLGDLLGRSRTLSLTILTYAIFTGLSCIAHTWWELMAYRFLAALGIGGEWAIGSSLLSETWPHNWRAWIAAVLQTGVNVGILVACVARYMMTGVPERYVFLVGIIPAFIVFWIREKVPEPAEWHDARARAGTNVPRISDLFRGAVLRTTLLSIGVCACSLTAWWAFLFWSTQHFRNLPEMASMTNASRESLVTAAFFLTIFISMGGNFAAAALARRVGYRRALALCFLAFIACFAATYSVPIGYKWMLVGMSAIGFCSGVFGLFTMYLPPLFPTLLRTTGAGFCYNIGRIFAAIGTIVFGFFAKLGDFRIALLLAGGLFIPATLIALLMPELRDEPAAAVQAMAEAQQLE